MKTMAVLKLAYLELYGYDMTWASFHVVEVMSSPKFQQKRVGYLAAVQSFREDTDALTLATNLLKKDIGSAYPNEVSISVSAVANIVTPSLAQDLCDDVLKMINHSKPYVRKKAILAMYKIFLQYPEALRTSFPRLKAKLQDPDPSVVCATVNVICELAKTNPKNYIELAPSLYDLLTTSSINWVLIKILKLFSSLAQIEPRLKQKIVPPIMILLEKTQSKSLMYEIVNCVVTGRMLGPEDYDIASIFVQKLRPFFGDGIDPEKADQNLKFVGLLALSKIFAIHPEFAQSHSDIIFSCINDVDITIRTSALGMIATVVTEDTLIEVVNLLKFQLTPENQDIPMTSTYRVQVIKKITELVSYDMYSNLTDFEWYSDLLVELVKLADGNDSVGSDIGEQLRDISVRVKEVRDSTVLASVSLATSQYSYSMMPSVLPAALWIVGEYPSYLQSPVEVIYHTMALISSNASGSSGIILDNGEQTMSMSNITIIGIQSIVKIYASFVNLSIGWTENRASVVSTLTDKVVAFLESFSTSLNFEVQERAVEFLELFKVIQQGLEEHPKDSIEAPRLLTLALPSLFNSYELNPVAPGSQWRIAVPDGLDLDSQIYEPELITDNDTEDDWDILGGGGIVPETISNNVEEWKRGTSGVIRNGPEDSLAERRRQDRLERQKEDPFYISVPSMAGTPSDSRSLTPEIVPKLKDDNSERSSLDVDTIPIRKLDLAPAKNRRKPKVKIIQDEMVEGVIESDDGGRIAAAMAAVSVGRSSTPASSNKNTFRIDSSNLANIDLNAPEESPTDIDVLRKQLIDSKSAASEEVIAKPKKKKKSTKKSKSKAEGEEKPKKKKKKAAKIVDSETLITDESKQEESKSEKMED